MDIDKLVREVGFCDVTAREFQIDENTNIEYYCCKKSLSCENKDCGTCEKAISRYVIIDISNEEVLNKCKRTILSSYEKFVQFQKNHLSKIFFYENSFVRYNIYLIFIFKGSLDEHYINLTNNLDYARKLFIHIDNFKEYFCFYDSIIKLKKKIPSDKNTLNELERQVERLHGLGLKSILVADLDNKDETEKFYLYLMKNKGYDYLNDNSSLKDFKDRYIYKDVQTNKPKLDKYNVKYISNIKLKNFRSNCFDTDLNINFGKANVIFGTNTAGKTSILDAIEYGFTGITHKYKNDKNLEDSEVEVVGNKSLCITSEEAKKYENQLKNIWYPYRIGSLNDMFCRVNYFDTDATYKFALEQDVSDIAFSQLKKLLCDSRLCDFEDCLKEHLELANFINGFNEKMACEKIYKDKITKSSKIVTFILKVFNKNYGNEINQNFEAWIDRRREKIKDTINIIEETSEIITGLINKQISSNIDLMNIVFRRLFSYQYQILWEKEAFIVENLRTNEKNIISTMSTAQKVCLALSIIFTQFFLEENAPRIILLDETVANFDAFHILNLFDFLKDITLTLNGVQIVLTTASEEVAKIAKNKFGFLEDEFYLLEIKKDEFGKSNIEKK